MESIGSRFEYGVYSTAAQKVKLVCNIRAKAQTDGQERTPVAVSAVLDRSGSMCGTKLKLVKATAKFMVKQLTGADSMGVVAYDDDVTVVAGMQRMDDVAKNRTVTAIGGIHDAGCTNLSGGLLKGVELLKGLGSTPNTGGGEQEWTVVGDGAAPVGPVSSCMLFTDGLANRGITEAGAIVNAVRAAASPTGKPDAAVSPPKVHCFGFGSDHDPKMLQDIASATGGTYYYLETADEIPAAFADALGGLLSTVVQGAELTITPLVQGGKVEVHAIDFKVTRGEAGAITIALGDMYSEEAKDLLMEASLPAVDLGGAAEGETPLLKLSVRYLDVSSGEYKTMETTAIATRAAKMPADQNPDELVTEHRLRVEAAMAMKEAVQHAESGHLSRAQERLKAAKAQMDGNVHLVAKTRCLQSAMEDLEECTADFQSESLFARKGGKKARAYYASHANQRSTNKAKSSAPFGAPFGATFGAPAAPTSAYMNACQERMMASAVANVSAGSGDDDDDDDGRISMAPGRKAAARRSKMPMRKSGSKPPVPAAAAGETVPPEAGQGASGVAARIGRLFSGR